MSKNKTFDLSTLKGYPNNPRTPLTENGRAKLGNSLHKNSKFLALREIIYDPETMEILGGNKRFELLVEQGFKDVPIEWVKAASGLTEEEKKEFVLLDNSHYETEFDYDIIQQYFSDINLDDICITIPNFEIEETPEAKEDDYVIPETIQTNIVLGDLFEIGNHRLLCGDSTDSEHVAKLMNGEKADMVFTDPPYGMKLNADYSSMEGEGMMGNTYDNVIGDNEDFSPKLINTIFSCFDYAKEIFVFGADYFAELIPNKNEGSWVVWDKRESEESGKNVDARFGSMFELCWSKQKHKRLIARIMWAGMMGVKDDSKRFHPTQKPTHLAKWFFNQWGNENDLIADIYLGSGSTMVASHQLKRKCYGMELSEKYCQLIIERMLKLDSTLIVKKNGIITNEFSK